MGRHTSQCSPVWFNWFYKEKQPVTINLNSAKDPSLKSVQDLGGGMSMVDVVFEFDYNYDGFPSEISLFFTSKFNSARPNVDITWITPDGREIPMSNMALSASNTYTISQDNALSRRLRGVAPEKGLFADPNDPSKVVKGTYKMVIEGLVFEEGADYDAKLVVYGKLHGLAGTDHRRRDITIALYGEHLWRCHSVSWQRLVLR